MWPHYCSAKSGCARTATLLNRKWKCTYGISASLPNIVEVADHSHSLPAALCHYLSCFMNPPVLTELSVVFLGSTFFIEAVVIFCWTATGGSAQGFFLQGSFSWPLSLLAALEALVGFLLIVQSAWDTLGCDLALYKWKLTDWFYYGSVHEFNQCCDVYFSIRLSFSQSLS